MSYGMCRHAIEKFKSKTASWKPKSVGSLWTMAQRNPISGRTFQFSAYIPDVGGKKDEETTILLVEHL
jgi:hypothetical protein